MSTKKWTAKAPAGVTSWDRIRLHADADDSRCAIWPPLGPYWCTGGGENFSTVVAYVPHGTSDDEIRKYWPEAQEIDRMQESGDLVFSGRFPKPDYWID